MRNSILLTVCLLLGIANTAANPFSTAGWTKLTVPEGNLSIMMPGNTQPVNTTESTDKGPVAVHYYSLTLGTEEYYVSWRDYPFTLASDTLTTVRKNQVGTGTILLQADTSQNGHPGNTTTWQKDGRTYVSLNYAIGSRLYQTIYVGNALTALIHGAPFIKSFQLTN